MPGVSGRRLRLRFQRFLRLMVGIDLSQQEPEHDALPEEGEQRAAVAGPERGLTDESAKAMAPHRLDHMPGAAGADPALAPRAQRDQRGIVAHDRLGDRVQVENVAGAAGEIPMIRAQR